MAAGKIRKTEIIINVLFWLAMTLSVVGLFIYGGYQLYRWRTDRGFHSFHVGTKKKKPTKEDSISEESTESEQSVKTEKSEKSEKSEQPKKTEKPTKSKPRKKLQESEEKPNPPSALALDMEYIDQELKVVLNKRDRDSPYLTIDYTNTMFGIHTLMHKSNAKAYESFMRKRGKFIMELLQSRFGDMKWNFNPTACSPGYWHAIIISSDIPQSLFDYYKTLPKSPLYTWYPDDLLDKIIDFSAKPENENENFIINLEPTELAGNTYYVYLNSFIRETNNLDFKQLAFERLTDALAKHLADKYKVELMYDEDNNQYYIPQSQRWQLEKNAKLSGLNPPFSALMAKREAERAKKAEQDKIEKTKLSTPDAEQHESNDDSDSQSCSAKSL